MPAMGRKVVGLAAAFVALAGALSGTHFGRVWAASEARFDDQGTFAISLAGSPIGTEKFSIRSSSDQVEAQADIRLQSLQENAPATLETFPKLVLDSQLHPQTYSWKLKGPESYQLEVDFRSSPARSRLHLSDDKEDIRTFQLPRDVLVLDNNVIHHYQLLLDRYYMTQSGKQVFQAYIPQDALPGLLIVQDAGPESIKLRDAQVTLEHLVVSADNAQIDLWVDSQHHLQRLYDAVKQLEAVRQ